MNAIRFLSLAVFMGLVACTPLPQRAGVPTTWIASPNFSERKPNFVVIHHTSNDTADQALRTLTNPFRAVSAHYLVGRDGTILQLVDERARAWHAGESKWGPNTDINSASLGIELDNNGHEPFPDLQISALLELLADIKQRYQIPNANFLGHADVAPKRKDDPSRQFPWKMLADRGFGLWCYPPLAEPPEPFESMVALSAIGYDTSDPEAALRAFKLHFLPQETSTEMTRQTRALIFCLAQKTMGN